MPLRQVTLRTYHVGFGDCFLLSFVYDDGAERNVLIDFGTTGAPPGKAGILLRVAQDIRERLANPKAELTAVVATHRHRDHIEGFRTSAKEAGPGDIIRACRPKLVMQPWTEDPALPTDATAPPDEPKKAFTNALLNLHKVSDAIAREAMRNPEMQFRAQLQFLGENNLRNKSAVDNLIEMGKAGIAEYVYFGYQTKLSELLPDVQVSVLGPPTLKQTETVRAQRRYDEAEYWHIWQRRIRSALPGFTKSTLGGEAPDDEQERANNDDLKVIFPGAARYTPEDDPPQARWFRQKMRDLRARDLMQLVRRLDGVLNNTSVILLFEFSGKKILFPGDAQIENWSYALDHDDVRKKLREVDCYKVGHHGSLNATPRSLLELFAKRRGGIEPVMTTVVSTLAEKHGRQEDGTEVPRSKLMSALADQTNLYSTQHMEGSDDISHTIDFLIRATEDISAARGGE